MEKILLYYKYIDIEDPQAIRDWQKELCQTLHIKGRILIAHEGINGTAAGTAEAIEQYIAAMRQHPLFSDIDFKYSDSHADDFPRLRVAVRPEIVSLGIDPKKLTVKDTGIRLEPKEVHELLSKKPKDLVILDTRNSYESKIGTFEGAITPDIENFREFPKYIDETLNQYKEKEVLMFCTGGVRCERATAYLKVKNVAKNVYQIHGGIHRYIEQYPDGYFRGKNYVFDGRIAQKANDDILTECLLCQKPCDDYTNCLNAACNEQYISCTKCISKFNNTYSEECKQLVAENKVIVRKIPAKTSACSLL